MPEHYDVIIIIGSGAGGGTLAHRLARSGKKVLILERGDWLPREVENCNATAVFVDNKYVSHDTWYDKEGKSFQPQIHDNVGGDDPTEGPRSAPCPHPPVSNEPRIPQLFDDLAKAGLLNSANHLHPNGLAKSSDVGRNYLFHNSPAFLAVPTEKNPTKFQKTLSVNDFYFGDDDFPSPMGNIQMVGKSSAPMYRGEEPLETLLAPTFALSDVPVHAVDFWLSTEDLPRPENPVRLNSNGDATSVLDSNCKAHDVDNPYVVDTSFFPSIGEVNPWLTATANALRVGDHLIERLG